jgi:hypothetical protein
LPRLDDREQENEQRCNRQSDPEYTEQENEQRRNRRSDPEYMEQENAFYCIHNIICVPIDYTMSNPNADIMAAVTFSAHLLNAITDIPHRGLYVLYIENERIPYKELAFTLYAY